MHYSTTLFLSTKISFFYALRSYATTLYLSMRISFLHMYYGTTQQRSTCPRELVSCICTTVLRNNALPIHEIYVLRYYATTPYLSTRISYLYMHYRTTQLRSTCLREVVSRICATVLRNYALPIHEK